MAGDDPDFEALLADVVAHPERLLDADLKDDEVLKLHQRLNTYAHIPDTQKPDKARAVAMSTTNLREDYLRRFTMTSLVGFLFRVCDEWEPTPQARRWTPERRGKKKKAAEPPPFTAAELGERTDALKVLGDLVREAAADAEETLRLSREADLVVPEKGGDAGERAAAEKKAAEAGAAARAAQEKSAGLRYALTYELRKMGLECDDHIDALAAEVSVFPAVKEVIDADPVRRVLPNMIEMPSRVAKGILSEFLRNWFEYDPDAHVRKAHDEAILRRDEDTVVLPGLGSVPRDSVDPARLPLHVLRARAASADILADADALRAISACEGGRAAALLVLRDPATADALLYLSGGPDSGDLDRADRFRRYLCPIPEGSPARPAIDIVPPADTFHRFEYYTAANYEELRRATDSLYHEKSDLEMAIIVYDWFEGTSDEVSKGLEDFRDKHVDEVMSDIRGVDVGQWVLLGDFAQNRAKVDFYNRNTEVLKRIFDRHMADKKLGADLMRNRVRSRKAENIRKEGPDAPGLADYRANVTQLDSMGGEKVISREEMLRLEMAKGDLKAARELEVIDQCRATIKQLTEAGKIRELTLDEKSRLQDAHADLARGLEMLEVPDDGIQVDVWTHGARDGGFGKTKFFTKAEAPLTTEEKIARITAEAQAADGGPATAAAEARADVPPLAPYAQAHLESIVATEKKATDPKGGSAPPA